MAYLAFVTHDLQNNTLEGTWLEPLSDLDGNIMELRPVRCRNYSAAEKDIFLQHAGELGQKYVSLAGW